MFCLNSKVVPKDKIFFIFQPIRNYCPALQIYCNMAVTKLIKIVCSVTAILDV